MAKDDPSLAWQLREELRRAAYDGRLVDSPELIEEIGAKALRLAILEAVAAGDADTAEGAAALHLSSQSWAAISAAEGQQLSGE